LQTILYTTFKEGEAMTEKSSHSKSINPYYLWGLAIAFIFSGILIDVYYEAHSKNNNSPPMVTLSQQPPIQLYKNFISENDAKHLIELAKNRLAPSAVQLSGQKVRDRQRTSTTAVLTKSEDEVVKRIEEKVCALVGCQISHIEPLQIVHYAPGQKYSAHHDYFSEKELPYQTGQRRHTFLIYLNDVPSQNGGATIFPALNIHIQPTLGTALYFQDSDVQGRVEPKTLHGGAEITSKSAEKWACNIWIRDKPFVAPQLISTLAH
jgi:prolyl 4-hydroxylase